ncbi:MAG: DedA family protein [Thermomicrobiales bacterium]|nr:DedA family protein [Thermomicrobiales bacterium]MCO5218610.1 DedA family protein [Thermomicrobiales bacterium]MCO5224287.1 DedA family protein [Thermomicrobiales bacterium]MCO5229008.1 DedA family protein [Thermomicrobiales bacterium]
MSDLLGNMSEWATRVMDALGYAGLAFLVALENVFPPIPSEVILPLAGFNSSRGSMNILLAIVFATVGSLIGAVILYYIGYVFGEERVRYIINRWGKWLGFKESDVDMADRWFDRHGGVAVMLCRVIPIVRSLISIPAGLRKMPLSTFMLFTTIGSLVWNSILVTAGYLLGDNWDHVEQYVGYLQYLVILVVLVIGVWWVWARMIKPRMQG